MSTVNGFQVGSETLKYNYESLDNYNTPNFSTSSSKTYAVGDYVMYNGKLYKCTTATTGGTWVSDNWTEVVLSDDVSDLNRQIKDKQNKPVSSGTAGQVLGLDSNLQPAWMDQTGGGIANLVDGSAAGSVRGINTRAEDSSYTMGQSAFAEGNYTTASGVQSHAEGSLTIASGTQSHAEGYGGSYTMSGTKYESGAKGAADHTEGYQTLTAPGQPGNHAEGYQTRATGGAAHAEGTFTTASGNSSHAEGQRTIASGSASHAEGSGTTASGNNSHAEGGGTTASADGAHAEGSGTIASGSVSHAEGTFTTASGNNSHAEGGGTISNHAFQHVFGQYNVADPSTAAASARGTYVEIVGNGTSNGTKESRSNARTLDWKGNEVLAGGLTVGAAGITIGSTTITEAQLTALLALLNS